MGWFSRKSDNDEYKLLSARTPAGGVIFWVKNAADAHDENFINRILKSELNNLPMEMLALVAASDSLSLQVVPSQTGYEVHIDPPGRFAGEYSVAGAWRALQSGDIGGGRRMLETICRQRPSELEPNALLAFELMREPTDRDGLIRQLQNLVGSHSGSCEAKALGALIQGPLFATDATSLHDGYERLREVLRDEAWSVRPQSSHGAALLVAATVAQSDVSIRMEIQGKIRNLMGQRAMRGMGQFMLRNREQALATFSPTEADLQDTASGYESDFGRRLTGSERNSIVTQIQHCCLAGKALTLRDMGRLTEAKTAWQEAAAATERAQGNSDIRWAISRAADKLLAE